MNETARPRSWVDDVDLTGLASAVRFVRTRSSDLVCQRLRAAIIQGEIHAGEFLSEEEVGRMVGLSKTPVREALCRLESEDLVRRTGRRGFEVLGLSTRDLTEIFEIRRLLEPAVYALATKNASEKQLAAMAQAVEDMEAAVLTHDVTALVESHLSFVTALYGSCGNKRLARLLLTLADYVRRSSRATLEKLAMQAVVNHRRILQVIAAGNTDAARDLGLEHVEFAYADWLEFHGLSKEE